MDTILSTLVNRRVFIEVEHAPETVGLDTRGREQIISPRRIEVYEGRAEYDDQATYARRIALVTGPYARETGATSAVYRTIRIDLRFSAAPDWLVGLAHVYLPDRMDEESYGIAVRS